MIDAAVRRRQTVLDLGNEFAVGHKNADELLYGSELTDRTHKDHETTIAKGNPGQIRVWCFRLIRNSSQTSARPAHWRSAAVQNISEAIRGAEEGTEPPGRDASLRAAAVEGGNSVHRRSGRSRHGATGWARYRGCCC